MSTAAAPGEKDSRGRITSPSIGVVSTANTSQRILSGLDRVNSATQDHSLLFSNVMSLICHVVSFVESFFLGSFLCLGTFISIFLFSYAIVFSVAGFVNYLETEVTGELQLSAVLFFFSL